MFCSFDIIQSDEEKSLLILMMKETGTRVFSYHRNETGFTFIFQEFETGFKKGNGKSLTTD